MKKVQKYFAGAALLMLATGCSHELLLEGEGKLVLNTSVSTDMKVVSRSLEDSLTAQCIIWISNEKGAVRRYDSENPAPSVIDLVAGNYVAQAWTGDSVPASWTARRFQGTEHFTITPGETTPVNLACKIANVGASVRYADGIEEVLSDFSMTIGHKIDTLLYVGREERRGYFMMPSIDKDLKFTLNGKQIDGSDFTYEGVIENAKPATEYVINVGYTKPSTDVGGAVFTIIIDEHEIEVKRTVEIIPAPVITGYGFDINSQVMAEKGTMGRRSVYVAAATEVTRVELESDEFKKISQLGGFNSFEILGLGAENKEVINNFGITWKHNYDAERDESLVQINFEENYLNALENGEYSFRIKATDRTGKSTSATLNLMISDAPVVTSAASEVAYFTATLNGRAAKADVTSRSFKFHRVGDSNWTTVNAEKSNGLDYTATLSGLTSNTEYEYIAVSDNFESPVTVRFKTRTEQQLPNSSFEEWCTYENAGVPAASYASAFWDTGNHGSKTMQNKQVTTQNKDAAFIHSGSASILLKSQFVGVLSIGKFAAGNVFAGKYLGTDGTDGILGWGRPFTETPKKVTLWAKYNPGTVQSGKGSGDRMKAGDKDQGIIYVALVDAQNKGTYNGTGWPCVIRTKTSELFDKNGNNVIAYGEHVFETATDGSGLVKIEIPLDYYRQGEYPANIIFVASASRYGDFFQGGEGSELYIDDIQLIYE